MTQGGGGEKSSFRRWLNATRYAVAAAVTVLIMVVIVNAIKVVLRPDSLQLSVPGGAISAGRFKPPPEELLAVELNLRAHNPSGRVRMYYLDITAYLFDKSTPASASRTPDFDSVVYFNPKDIAVLQQETVDSFLALKLKKASLGPPYFDVLYNGSRVSDMTLRLDGNLVTEVTSELNKSRQASYYCEQLLVGGNSDDEAIKYRQNVICKQGRGLN